jgi:hypothetical protein
MKVFAIIVDQKPVMCIDCLFINSCRNGVYKDKVDTFTDSMGTWERGGTVPGPNCPLMIKEGV